MLYTRKGDNGTSGLFGTRERFTKDNVMYDALGTLDELNSILGMCRAHIEEGGRHEEIDITGLTFKSQEAIFCIQAELAGSDKKIHQTQVDTLERAIDSIEVLIRNPHSFVIPGANCTSAWFDIARTIARRAERCVVKVESIRGVSPEAKAYLNRLSSLLYVLARYAARQKEREEAAPSYT